MTINTHIIQGIPHDDRPELTLMDRAVSGTRAT